MAQVESTSRIDVGTLIADTYEIKRLLGRGGMGTVWEASHARLPGKRVAIKVLHPEVAKDAESLARFRREAEIASRIGHPNIVDVHDFNELADGTPYLILEYLEGMALEDRIHNGPMDLAEVISIARQIGSALRAAHAEGVVHRDLKPQNIFLAKTTDAAGNAAERARVLDFGISKIRGSSTVQTQDSTILGTPQYMAPEQATGNHSSVDQRTDVFALGAMLYEMVSGKAAFDGQTIPEVVFKVVYEEPTPLDQVSSAPPQVTRAIHQALAKKQEERFQTVEAFIEALSGTALSMQGARIPSAVHQQQADVGLASTIASGHHPAVPGVGIDQTAPALGTAATIDSGRMDQGSLGLGNPRPAIAESASSGSQVTSGKTGTGGLKLALVLVTLLAVGGGGIAVWALTRSGNDADKTVAAAETLDAGAGALATALDASSPVPVVEPDAAVAKTLTKKERLAKEKEERTKKKAKERERKEAAAAAKKEREEKERAEKEKAEAALAKSPEAKEAEKDYQAARKVIRSNPQKALRLIRRALTKGGPNPKYYAVQAKAHCVAKNLAAFKATFGKVRSHRGSVKRFCDKVWPDR